MIQIQPGAPRCVDPYAAPEPARQPTKPWTADQTESMPAGTGTDIAPVSGGQALRFDSDATDGLTSVAPDDFNDHMSADEAARHSWRALLARNVGRSVIANFLLGTQNTVSVEGELYEVGTDYLVIYQPAWDSHITADLYSVKFVEFREPPSR